MSDNEMDVDSSTNEDIKKYIKDSTQLVKDGWGGLTLRGYQVAGVNWMIDRLSTGQGCILGDEMGLGKTCQTIAVIAYLHGKSKAKHPNLVVAPRTVLENWGQEIKRFAPGLKAQLYLGEKESRHELAAQIKQNLRKGNKPFDVLITNYEMCLKDSSFLHSIEWNLLIVDEAHRLKNLNSLLYTTLTQWDYRSSILLTGTPVQNNLQELYALLSFVAPKKFPAHNHEAFVDRFSKVEKKAKELHHLLKPYLLLRRKTDVLKDLPSKSEVILTHGISKLQTKLYRGILTKDLDVFENESSYGQGKQTKSLMNILMQLRKCVNHPYLFDGVEPEPFELGEHLVEASGKLVVIDQLLKYLHTSGHKVLLFSQMTHMLDILQDYLGYRGYSYERLDGSVRGEERFLAVRKFNENEDTFAFLLSTRAGGQGINLTSADTVIFVDSDFNPQNDLQAAARAHRIGQTRPVKIIRLIGKNTVEEIILKRAEDKLRLTNTVIKEGEFSLGAGKQGLFTDDSVKLQDILKYGVDELFGEKAGSVDDLDLRAILGPTSSGEWQPEETPTSSSVPDTASDEDEGILQDAPQSMYVFEGTDYSKEPTAADKTAFDKLIEAEREVQAVQLSEDRPSRLKKQSTTFMGGLPDLGRKPRKKLTPEELAERKKKREENAAKRAKEAEEQEMRRAQKLKQKKEELWRKNSYESCNIELASDDEESDDGLMDDDAVIDDDDDGDVSKRDIHYISGDVTQPRQTDRQNNIIVHCADDSGNWGKGGLFSAISARSSLPETQYTLAGKVQDVALGDCHLISMDEAESKTKGKTWLALIIAQHRDKRNYLSGIKLSALRYGLEKVYRKAKEHNASVHLPRIGHDTPAFNWYGTEKLIKKHLASRGIPTYIYYFPRKLKRKLQAANTSPPAKVSRDDAAPSTSGISKTSSKPSSGLLNIFSGTSIYLHRPEISDDDYKKYKRFIVAYDGDLEKSVTDNTSHIVIAEHSDTQVVSKLTKDCPGAKIVTTDWLDDCLQKKSLVKTVNYEIS